MAQGSKFRTTLSASAAAATFAAFAIAWAGPAHAAESQNKVQLQAFQVKVVDARGRQGQMPVTVYIDTPNRKGSNDVCGVAPRVRDALNTFLRKVTYQLDERGNLTGLDELARNARPVVEDAAKKENVAGVEIRQGAPSVKPSAASMFARSGCISVTDAVDEAKGGKGEAKH